MNPPQKKVRHVTMQLYNCQSNVEVRQVAYFQLLITADIYENAFL